MVKINLLFMTINYVELVNQCTFECINIYVMQTPRMKFFVYYLYCHSTLLQLTAKNSTLESASYFLSEGVILGEGGRGGGGG